MTKRELMQMALDALIAVYSNPESVDPWSKCVKSIDALKAELAKSEPEPVAWKTKDTENGHYAMWGQKPTSEYWIENYEKLIPLYRKEDL